MTPNEKELLGYFKETGEANVLTMVRKMDFTVDSTDYVRKLCNSLTKQGYLEKISGGRHPDYRLRKEKKSQKLMRGEDMTPNEKELLNEFKMVKKASVFTMSKKMDFSVDYTRKLCNGLLADGFLERVTPGKWSVYKIKEK